MRRSYLTRVLGIDSFSDEDVEEILGRLGFGMEKAEGGWKVKAPAFRHDVTREIDLVEEFIRVFGMDKVEPVLPTFTPATAAVEEAGLGGLRARLSSMGLTEVVSYSFISPKWSRLFGGQALELLNPISDEMKAMRTSLIPGLATTAARNKNLQTRDMSMFEIGKCFFPKGKGVLPDERQKLGIALSGCSSDTHWSQKPRETDFYDIKGLMETILPGMSVKPSSHGFYCQGCQADILVGEAAVGHMGALSRDVLDMLDVTDDIFTAEISVEALLARNWQGMQEIPRFPMTWRDLSLVADEGVAYEEILKVIDGLKIAELRRISAVDLYSGEKLPKGKKGITVRLTYQSDTRTLEDSIINKWQEKIIQKLTGELGISLRQ